MEIPIEDVAVLQPVDGPSGPAAASPGNDQEERATRRVSVKPLLGPDHR